MPLVVNMESTLFNKFITQKELLLYLTEETNITGIIARCSLL
jgi:hypothetical protein